MSKTKEWPKELVFIDLNRDDFEYFNIELIKVSYNHFQVIFHYGKYGNKGTNRIYRFNGNNSFLEAKKLAYNKFYEMKSEGYIRKEKMEEAILNAVKQEQKLDNEKKKFKDFSSNNSNLKYECDICKNPIHYSLYGKINSWGRGEGNWDYSSSSPLYKKVVCLDCQIDKGIFQKRIDENAKF